MAWFDSLAGVHGVFELEHLDSPILILMIAICIWVVMSFKNSYQTDWNNISIYQAGFIGLCASISFILMNYSSKFLYFQF
jgi:hypothetical protein